MLEFVSREFGRLDLLVNNAGVAPNVRADLLEAGEESFDRLIGINLKGPYFLTQKAARLMADSAPMRGRGARGGERDQHLGVHRLDQPRRLLRGEGGAGDDDETLRGAAGGVRDRRI